MSGEAAIRLRMSGVGWSSKGLPLTEKVSFQAMLQRGNRLQIPRIVRWRFKLECDQGLKVTASCSEAGPSGEHFYASMSKDGLIVVPKPILSVLGILSRTLKVTLSGLYLNLLSDV